MHDVAALIAPHADGLWRFARQLARSDAEADDLAQEAFATALRRAADLRDPRAVRRWVARIVLRTWQNASRRVSREEPLADAIGGLAGPEQAAGDRQVGDRLRAAFDRLDPERAVAVWLVDAEGYTLAEASEILEIPLGTVCSRLARGRTALRALLADLAPEAS